MDVIRVLIADDQELFSSSLKKVLELSAPDISVVDIARTGEEAISSVKKHNPDVVLMDVRMPVLDGVKATKEIHALYPDIHIMMLTTFDNDSYVHDALHFGATAYLLKDIPLDELIASIRAIRNVSILLSPQIVEHLSSYRQDDTAGVDGEEAEINGLMEKIEELSRRERDVFDLMLKGFNNQIIGEQLFLAEQTVRNYISRIYQKLDVVNRLDLIRKLRSR